MTDQKDAKSITPPEEHKTGAIAMGIGIAAALFGMAAMAVGAKAKSGRTAPPKGREPSP